jgi:hypothetical protein
MKSFFATIALGLSLAYSAYAANPDLQSLLQAVLDDYINNFENLKGEKIEDSELILTQQYTCALDFDDPSAMLILNEDLLSGDRSFQLRFPDMLSKDEALARYEELKAILNETSFSQIIAVADEYISDNPETVDRSFSLIPFLADLGYENLIIELKLMTGFEFTDDFEIVDEYWISISVYTLYSE